MKSRTMIAAMSGIVAAVYVMTAIGEEPPINPSRITTPQIVVYGTSYDSTYAGNVTIAGTLGVTGATTLTGAITGTGGVTSKGRATVTSADTTHTMVQGYTCNAAAQLNATIVTQAFTTAFSSVPAVTFSGPTNELNLAITALTTNSVTIGTLSASNITLRIIAVGPKSN